MTAENKNTPEMQASLPRTPDDNKFQKKAIKIYRNNWTKVLFISAIGGPLLVLDGMATGDLGAVAAGAAALALVKPAWKRVVRAETALDDLGK